MTSLGPFLSCVSSAPPPLTQGQESDLAFLPDSPRHLDGAPSPQLRPVFAECDHAWVCLNTLAHRSCQNSGARLTLEARGPGSWRQACCHLLGGFLVLEWVPHILHGFPCPACAGPAEATRSLLPHRHSSSTVQHAAKRAA